MGKRVVIADDKDQWARDPARCGLLPWSTQAGVGLACAGNIELLLLMRHLPGCLSLLITNGSA